MKKIILSIAAISAIFGYSDGLFSNGEDTSFVDGAWSAAGFVMGYGDRDAYIKYACNSNDPGDGKSCEGPSERGMVGTMVDIANSVTSAFDYTKCSEIPTTGDTEVDIEVNSNDVTVSIDFAEAENTIPDAYVGAGVKFDRRMEMTFDIGTTVKLNMEVSCLHAKTAVFSINQLVGDQAPGYERHINIWIGQKDDVKLADIYFSEVNDDDEVRSAAGFALAIDEAAGTFKMWGSTDVFFGGAGGTLLTMDTYNLVGNYQDHDLSMRVKRYVTEGSSSRYDLDALEDIDGSDDDVLEESDNYDLVTAQSGLTAGSSADGQGCINFESPDDAPSSNDACDDLDFEDSAPTPVIDEDGAFSPAWVIGSMHKNLVDIPSL